MGRRRRAGFEGNAVTRAMLNELSSIDAVDFLPASFREKSRRWRSSFYHALAIAGLGTTVAGLAIYQQTAFHRAERLLADVHARYDQALADNARFAELQKELGEVEADAQIRTYLRHPWPRSRLLSSVIAPLPDSLVLTDIQLLRQARETAAAPTAAPALAEQDLQKELEKHPPRLQDLKRLRPLFDNSEVAVKLEGRTSSIAALHGYLSELNRNPLFAKAELDSIAADSKETTEGAKFSLRVQVLPGFGQPGGPTAPIAAPTFSSLPVEETGRPRR